MRVEVKVAASPHAGRRVHGVGIGGPVVVGDIQGPLSAMINGGVNDPLVGIAA